MIIVCMSTGNAHVMAHMERSEDNFQVLVLSPLWVLGCNSGSQAPVACTFYLLSHLADPYELDVFLKYII